LFTATVAVVMVRGSSPSNIILICLAIGAAALVGLGTLRTLRPLLSAETYQPEMIGSRTRAALEREKNLLLRSLKELEFDHAMGKVSASDYEEMTARLRSRAVRLIKQLDSAGSGYREIIERELASRLGRAGPATLVEEPVGPQGAGVEGPVGEEQAATVAGTCATCGTSNDPDARFCKRCGTKLLVLILAVLAFASTAWAQFQMPDPKQMSGIPRPVTDLPEGHISVRLIRGQLSNNIPNYPVELHDLTHGDKVVTVKTDENGRAEFSGIAGGTQVRAVAVVDGERLESEEFPAPTQGGIRLLLVATLKGGEAGRGTPLQPISGIVVLGDQTRVIFDLADDALQVYYLLDFENTARAPVNPPSAVSLDLPKDAEGPSIVAGAPQAIVRGNRVTVTGPFAPGRTEVEVGYQLPYSGGDVTLNQKFSLPVGNVAVLMKKVGNMSLTSPQLPEQQEREFQGEHYVLAQGASQAAGGTLTLSISGLPHHSPVPRTIALVLACVMVAAGVWAARARQPASDGARVKQLKGKREKIFSELVRLEQQRHTGSVDASRYAERRPALIAQLERVYRDLDTEGGQGLAA
jgi:zinc ribbon protein